MPGRIAEPGKDEGEPDEQRDRAEDEQDGDDQSPAEHLALLACAARHEAETASDALTSQSTSIGSEATLSASTTQPKIAPTTAPRTISAQPRGVVKNVDRKPLIDVGVAQPKSSP